MNEEISLNPLNFDDDKEVREVAYLHQSAPRYWNPNHKVNEEGVIWRTKFLKESKGNPDIFIITAKNKDNILVGMHWLRVDTVYDEKCGHIDSLWVHDDYQRRGIAKMMKDKGEEWARSKGLKFLYTQVFYTNKRMIDYNVKLGFVPRQVEMIKDL